MTRIPILTLYPDDAHVVQNPVRLGPGANNDSIGSDPRNGPQCLPLICFPILPETSLMVIMVAAATPTPVTV